MEIDTQTIRPTSPRRLLLLLSGAVLAATAIGIGVVLPAEFQIDPTGFGRITGLDKLGTPQPKGTTVSADATSSSTHEYAIPYRSDTVDIPMAASGDPKGDDELEYKVSMQVGDSFVYSWTVAGVPAGEFYFDFHGETPAEPGVTTSKVIEYKKATGISSNGTLIAPIPGVHGWYLQNQSTKRVVVKLRLSGFYQLIPPGSYGNLAGLEANTPADTGSAKQWQTK